MTDQDCDPFGERARVLVQGPLQLLGCQYRFESNSRELLKIVQHAYAGLPRYALSAPVPQMTIRLLVSSPARPAGRSAPPPIQMVSGAGLLGGVTASGNSVFISPEQRSALIVVSPRMLHFPYHSFNPVIDMLREAAIDPNVKIGRAHV